jgi:hypothetical protein
MFFIIRLIKYISLAVDTYVLHQSSFQMSSLRG